TGESNKSSVTLELGGQYTSLSSAHAGTRQTVVWPRNGALIGCRTPPAALWTVESSKMTAISGKVDRSQEWRAAVSSGAAKKFTCRLMGPSSISVGRVSSQVGDQD